MEIELGFQPNCSELVLHIPGMKKRKLLAALSSVGIRQEAIEGFWPWSPDEKENLVTDMDNPALPDVRWQATMRIKNDYVGATSYNGGCCIVASQHCQSQNFPTIKKIIDFLDKNGISYEGPNGDDGGSSNDYEEWVEKGCKTTIDKKEMMKVDVLVDKLTNKQVAEVREKALKTFGLKMRRNGNVLVGTFDPTSKDSCVISPERFCATGREVRFVTSIITLINTMIHEMVMENRKCQPK